MRGLFPSVPIWVIFIGTLLLVALCVEGGYRWAKWRQSRGTDEKEAPIGEMVGALLGLLAFLLAVTFGIATDTFLARKRAMIEEANAIRSAYMRAGLISDADRDAIRMLLREYVNARLRWAGADAAEPGRSSQILLNEIWARTEAVGRANPNAEVIALFVEGVNNVETVHHERVLIRERTRIPGAFWFVLYFLAILSLMALGYHVGSAGKARSPVMITVAVAFSLVIVLILDIDRPGEGFVNVSQQSMVEVRDSMTRAQP